MDYKKKHAKTCFKNLSLLINKGKLKYYLGSFSNIKQIFEKYILIKIFF